MMKTFDIHSTDGIYSVIAETASQAFQAHFGVHPDQVLTGAALGWENPVSVDFRQVEDGLDRVSFVFSPAEDGRRAVIEVRWDKYEEQAWMEQHGHEPLDEPITVGMIEFPDGTQYVLSNQRPECLYFRQDNPGYNIYRLNLGD